jgi:hypothetical protein
MNARKALLVKNEICKWSVHRKDACAVNAETTGQQDAKAAVGRPGCFDGGGYR